MPQPQREIRCIEFKPAFRSIAQVNVSPQEGFSLGEGLQSVYPLLGLVFDYLSYNDLKRVSLVNSTWQAEAEKKITKRINNSPSWLTIYCESKEKSYCVVKTSKNLGYDGGQYGIIFNNRNFFMPVDNKELDLDVKSTVKSFDELTDFVSQPVASDVGFCNIFSSDLYSVYPRNYINPMTKLSFVDVCIFPIIPNIRVATVNIPPTLFTEDVFNKTPNEKIKCVLVFSKSDLTSGRINRSVFMKKNYPDCAFGGGFTPIRIQYRNEDTDKQYMKANYFCIGFIENTDGENNNFDAGSFVIGEEVESADDFEKSLIQLKRKITIREHSLAFRFCCAAKTTSAQEAVIFHKIFPNTIQYGINVNGEIGWNTKHVNEDNAGSTPRPQRKRRRSLVDVTHQYSSVIVFLTWGRIIPS